MLRTSRLLIRPWTAEDLPDALALWGDARVMAYLSSVEGGLTADEIEQRLAREIESQQKLGIQYWKVHAGDDFVGCCGLKHSDVDGTTLVEMGFHLVPAHWGRGYATEASRCVIDHAFEKLRVPELFAGHHPRNAASQRVLAKLGFQRLGDRFYQPTGLLHPWYSLKPIR